MTRKTEFIASHRLQGRRQLLSTHRQLSNAIALLELWSLAGMSFWMAICGSS